MIKLYGTRNSRAFRCLWALEEANLDYDLIEIDWQTGQTRTADFLALNPNGHVPVFEQDGLVLIESLAINLHISQTAAAAFAPATSQEQTQAVQWTVWAMGELEGPHDSANRQDVDVGEAQRQAALGVLNQHLADRDYLVADRFTVADLNVASVLMRPKYMPHVSGFEALADWFGRCAGRPALARALGRA
ncbi:MAG: glutathione S-transferase family protein [Pseudomonadota bacterium]